MPIIKELYNNNSSFNLTGWTSEWLDCSNSFEVVFTAFNSQNYQVGIRWSVDNAFQPLSEEVYALTGGNSYTIRRIVKFRKVQFFVQNISLQPSVFRSEGFFYLE